VKYIWKGMIQRCENPRNPSFARYGGRGIRVCLRWRRSFADFVSDVGPRPTPLHTIDRIDNARGYEPANVRWATRQEQAENRADTRLLFFHGRTQTVRAWEREFGLKPNTLGARLDRGWNARHALTTRVDRKFGRRESPQGVPTTYPQTKTALRGGNAELRNSIYARS